MKFTAQAGKIDGIGIDGKNVAVVKVKVPGTKGRKNHTILVVDCSVSMQNDIANVRRDTQEYVDKLGEKDFASTIIFSGHGRARLIAGPTQCNPAGKKLLKRAIETDVKVIDVTVFSEPLELSIETVKKLAGPEMVHNVVLFTDGCAVPQKWSLATEQQKSLTAVATLSGMNVALSIIGYGVYYDAAFINGLMQASGNIGIFRHISEINEFGPVIENIRSVFADTVISDISLTFTPNKGKAERVFKTTPQLFASSENGKIFSRGFYQGEATLYVELTELADSLVISGTINGKKINETVASAKLENENAADFVRVLGAYAFLTGDRATAAQMLMLTGDEGLAEKAAESYTNRESREAGDTFRRLFVDKKFIGEGLKPTGPNHSVLNVIRELIEEEENVVYLDMDSYKLSGLMTKDPRVYESPVRTLRVVSYKSHVSRKNFSITCLKDVKVMPEDGIGPPVDKKIWRTYNIILDGNLRTPTIKAAVAEKSYEKFFAAGVIDNPKYVPGKIYTLNLRKLKMITPNWANPATLGLVNLLREEANLKVEQTALNARKKALGKPDDEDGEGGGDIYIEKAETVENVPFEYYSAECCEYKLMKYKAAAIDCSKMTYEEADARVKAVRQRLIVIRFLSRAIVFAMELVGSKSIPWGPGKLTSSGKTEQLADYLGATLKRVEWEETFVCS